MIHWKKNENTETNQNKGSMLVLRRKQIVAVSLIILIAVAGYLNWTFTNDHVDPDVATMYTEASKKLGEAQMVSGTAQETESQPSPSPAAGSDYFSQAKMDRDIKRSESIEMLMDIVNNPNTDKESRTKAEDDAHRLATNTEQETNMENQIKAKGFSNAVAFITGEKVSIAVSTEGLTKQDAAIIQEIVTTTSGMKAEQMQIMEVKPAQ